MYSHSRKKEAGYVPLLAVAPPPNRQGGQPSTHTQQGGGTAVAAGGAGGGLGRRISPAPERGRFPSGTRVRSQAGPINIGQPTGMPSGRQRDKFVPLPEEDDDGIDAEDLPPADLAGGDVSFADAGVLHELQSIMQLPTPAIFEDLPRPIPLRPDDSRRGRITFYCVAESFDRKKLDELLKASGQDGTPLSACVRANMHACMLLHLLGISTVQLGGGSEATTRP